MGCCISCLTKCIEDDETPTSQYLDPLLEKSKNNDTKIYVFSGGSDELYKENI